MAGQALCRFSSILSLLFLNIYAQDASPLALEARRFRTRPEIEAPRWNITVHDQKQVSPGYWFVSPYDNLEQGDYSSDAWVAPMIFDQAGELVWSGAYLTHGYNSFDFRVSKVMDEDMLTLLHPNRQSFFVLNSNFTVSKEVEIANTTKEQTANFHELNFVNDGKRALFFFDKPMNATKPQQKELGGHCLLHETTFREADLLEDWRFGYLWMASKRIDFNETTTLEGTLQQRCNETETGWDFAHLNSVDKFNKDGSYLLSAQHTNTIYKIFRSGDIAWRLGGIWSDFEADFTFSNQNHARIISHNASHTVISLFDSGDSEHGSRGLLVSLQTDITPMTATLMTEFAHPDSPRSYVSGGGSVQVLPDANVFSGWVDGLAISEHDSSGHLLMSARVGSSRMKSYRSYKFPFIGHPAQVPDVYAEVDGGVHPVPKTTVYMSWNGATEVASWKVYRVTNDGTFVSKQALVSASRTNFESTAEFEGYAAYVTAEALDKDGKVLGQSNGFRTEGFSQLPDDVLEEEHQRLESVPSRPKETEGPDQPDESAESAEAGGKHSWKDKANSRTSLAGFFAVLALIGGMFFLLRRWRRRRVSWTATANGGHRRKPSDHELLNRGGTLYALEDEDEDDGYDGDKEGR